MLFVLFSMSQQAHHVSIKRGCVLKIFYFKEIGILFDWTLHRRSGAVMMHGGKRGAGATGKRDGGKRSRASSTDSPAAHEAHPASSDDLYEPSPTKKARPAKLPRSPPPRQSARDPVASPSTRKRGKASDRVSPMAKSIHAGKGKGKVDSGSLSLSLSLYHCMRPACGCVSFLLLTIA